MANPTMYPGTPRESADQGPSPSHRLNPARLRPPICKLLLQSSPIARSHICTWLCLAAMASRGIFRTQYCVRISRQCPGFKKNKTGFAGPGFLVLPYQHIATPIASAGPCIVNNRQGASLVFRGSSGPGLSRSDIISTASEPLPLLGTVLLCPRQRSNEERSGLGI